MKRLIVTTIVLFTTLATFAQASDKKSNRDVGINYYGELAFRPGLELDYGINLWGKSDEKEKRTISNHLNFRPSLAYYRYAHYSNNFLLATKLNYQFRFNKKETEKYFYIEPFVKVGFLRYFLAGDVYISQGNGFSEVRFKGSNSLVFGSGFDVGGALSQKLDWLFGFDYYAESTEDKLILHRFVMKLGTRIKINGQ